MISDRPRRDELQSLGGRFVELPIEAKDAQDARGYATAQGEDFYRRQRELLGQVVQESDVVITTAVIPGKKAPILVTEEMVKGMALGSVIVDLAAERGGNCDITEIGKTVVKHGVTIIGDYQSRGRRALSREHDVRAEYYGVSYPLDQGSEGESESRRTTLCGRHW